MPTLDIREGAIELLMRTYKSMLPEMGGYLAHGSTLNFGRVEKFIQVWICVWGGCGSVKVCKRRHGLCPPPNILLFPLFSLSPPSPPALLPTQTFLH